MVQAQLEDGEYTVVASHDEYGEGQEDVVIEGMDEEVTVVLGDEEAENDLDDDDDDDDAL